MIVDRSGEHSLDLVKEILQWIAVARRPLQWRELQSVVSLDLRRQEYDKAKTPHTSIADLCGSLVEILPDDRVELCHSTARL